MRRFRFGSAVVLVILTAGIIRASAHTLALQAQARQALTPSGQTTRYGKALLEALTLGVYDGASREAAALAGLAAELSQAQRATALATGALVLLGLVLLGSELAAARSLPLALAWRWLGAPTLGLSGLLLVLGVTTPLVTISVPGRVPGQGLALLTATSRGILAAPGELWSGPHRSLALLVFAVGLALPVARLVLAGWALAQDRPSLRAVRLLQAGSTWAMADVLVVAVLIVLLSPLGQDAFMRTQAQAGPGLYFFAGFCLLSMLATGMLGRSAATPVPPPAPRLRRAGDDT